MPRDFASHSIAELEQKIEELRFVQDESAVDISEEIGKLSEKSQEQVLAYEYEGVRYDCGSKLGYLKATVDFALRHPEVKEGFSEFLKTR
jgi:UTP-glucose-1-phosphate uridylyltransferase